MIKIIAIGGHGAGKQHNRGGLLFNEGDNNYKMAKRFKYLMETNYKGVVVDLGRKKITDDPTLHKRAMMTEGYDLALMFHSNAAEAGVRGTEVFDSAEKPNYSLSTNISKEVSKVFKHRNRGRKVKTLSNGKNWYGELRNHKSKSAMILELGFHTNLEDSKVLVNNLDSVLMAIVDQVALHYNLKGAFKMTRDEVLKIIREEKEKEANSKAQGWSLEAIEYVKAKGIMKGYEDGSFKPNKPITRAEAAKIIMDLYKGVK